MRAFLVFLCILPFSEQSGPLKPKGHAHLKHLIPSSEQFPPFLQGVLSHGRTEKYLV